MLEFLDRIDFAFRQVDGAIFISNIRYEVSDEQLAETIRSCGGCISRAEEDCNRFFIVQDFFSKFCPGFDYSAEDLLNIARAYANLLDLKLQSAFPEELFCVEIVGDNLANEEPLEMCVTFHTARARSDNNAHLFHPPRG